MRISAKLILGFTIVMVISFSISAIGLNRMFLLRDSGISMYEERILALQYVNNAAMGFSHLRINSHQVVISSLYNDRQGAETAKQRFEDGVTEFTYWLELSYLTATDSELIKFHDTIFRLFETYYLPQTRTILAKSIDDIPDHFGRLRINVLIAATRNDTAVIESLLTGLVELNSALAEQTNYENAAITQNYIILQLIFFIIAIITACIVAMVIIKSIARPIKESAEILSRIATGDFSLRVLGNYSGDMALIKDSVNNTAAQLATYVEELKHAIAEMHRIEVAEENSRAKSRFLARMSHEIRTPITAVLGISEIELQNTDLSPHIEESFAKIHNSANALLHIVNDILDLSKIEAGKMEILEGNYDTADMISDVTNLHFAVSNDIKFMVNVDENLPVTLVGDSLRIVQIINNLLSNAFKYTESGSVTLTVAWDLNKSDLVFTIKDTGLGMTKEQVGNLLNWDDEYTRFHERSLPGTVGTGLGIPIVYSIVQLMGGKIDLKSQEDVGTTVTVRLPQNQPGTDEGTDGGTVEDKVLGKDLALRLQQFDVGPSTENKKFQFKPTQMPHGKVLVVDDVEMNLYVAQGLLAFYSLNVETCDSGYAAIENIKQGKVYDLVLMDQMMPGLNGDETLRIMREMGYTNPVVALTANAMMGQEDELIEYGFDGFISKPIQTPELNAILTKYIGDK